MDGGGGPGEVTPEADAATSQSDGPAVDPPAPDASMAPDAQPRDAQSGATLPYSQDFEMTGIGAIPAGWAVVTGTWGVTHPMGVTQEMQVAAGGGILAYTSGFTTGNYVVEIMSPVNNAVVAASPVLNVSTGEAVSALVKLPFRIPPFAGLLGNTSQTTASAVSSAAQSVTAAAAASNTVAETLAGAAATTTTTSNGR